MDNLTTEEVYVLPTSFTQRQLWLINQLEPDSPAYNIPIAVRLNGSLDVRALEQSLAEIVNRHETLRTTFSTVDGEVMQVVSPSASLELSKIDLSDLPESERGSELLQIVKQTASHPFDLAAGPLMRTLLLRLSEHEHVIAITMHHIISDGWSLNIFVREMVILYNAYVKGEESPLDELPIQYGDFAVWQRQWLQADALSDQLSYWHDQLADAPSLLELPTDRPRPPSQSYSGATSTLMLSSHLNEAIKKLSREQGCTPFMTLLAAFKVLLMRYTHQHDIVVGTPIANRRREELEGLIGYFANTLALRTKVEGGMSFKALMGRVKEVALGGYGNQDVPFEKVVERMKPERTMSYSPIFQVMFVMQSGEREEVKIDGLALSAIEIESGAVKFDLSLMIAEIESELLAKLQYNTDLFNEDHIERIIKHYQILLESVVANPDQLISEIEIMSAAERHEVLNVWNQTERKYESGKCVHELIEQQAEQRPNELALVCEQEQVTYAELNSKANKLAHRLRSLGVGPDVPVAICMERSTDIVVALLGVMKAGGAYLVLDPALPKQRLAFMLEDSKAPVLLIHQRLLDLFTEPDATILCFDRDWPEVDRENEVNPINRAVSENLIYITYTSGSTGRPKGVMVEHRQLLNYFYAANEKIEFPSDACFATVTTFAADLGNTVVFAALLTGGTLHIVTQERAADSEALADYFIERDIDCLKIVPSHLVTLLSSERDGELVPRRRLIIGGEACRWEIVEKVKELGTGCRIFNHYGPTETTVGVLIYEATEGRADTQSSTVPLGKPIGNINIYLLDQNLKPVSAWNPGELYIGGEGLARGYFAKPDQTADRFIPNPFGKPGSRFYKTGDLARYLPDGNIEFLGRIDHQVKVRGYRIELGEIETHLRDHLAVKEAVAIVRQDQAANHQIIAYVVMKEDATQLATPDPAEINQQLRNHLKQRVPDYMLPALIVPIDAVPLTPNGKLDRACLPDPSLSLTHIASHFVAPRNPNEEIVASIWLDLLDINICSIHDSFFDLGGHSLLATRLASKLRAAFAIELPLRAIFDKPTIAQQAALIESASSGHSAGLVPPLLRADRQSVMPLSYAQERLWFLAQFQPDSPFYNVPAVVRLSGPLNVPALRSSLQAVINRHESLRTVFDIESGQPVQRVLRDQQLDMLEEDLTALPQHVQQAELSTRISREAGRGFDLQRGPLVRATLIRLQLQESVLVLVMHHIVSDGWSAGVMVREAAQFYECYDSGGQPRHHESGIQYVDYAMWQRAWLTGDVLEQQLGYWHSRLADAPALLELPTDRPRPPEQGYCGASSTLTLSSHLNDGIRKLSREQGCTPFMTLLAAFKVLLMRYTHQHDIVVGTPIANRRREELEHLIGYFANTLALRTKVEGGMSFKALMGRVKEVALGGYGNQDVPFEKVVERLRPERTMSYSPIFQVMFVMQSGGREEIRVKGLRVEREEVESGTAKYDLTMVVEDGDEGAKAVIEFNTDLFDEETINRMLRHYEILLKGVIANPEELVFKLPLLSETEERLLLEEWSNANSHYEEQLCIHNLFEEQVKRAPHAVAVTFEEEQLNYSELNRKANQVAHYLSALGVGPEISVGLCVDRSLHMIVGLLGILKAGGYYLPLDPSYPSERLDFMLKDGRVSIVLTQESMAGEMRLHCEQVICIDSEWGAIAEQRDSNPTNEAAIDNLAYVMYTSGSTGRPKGVSVTHRGIARLVKQANYVNLSSEEVFLHLAPIIFDASTFEIWGCLLNGARLVVMPARTPSTEELGEAITRYQVTTLWLTAGLFHLMVDEQIEDLKSVRQLLAGGDVLSAAHVKKMLRQMSAGVLINGYGPTESTTFACCHQMNDRSQIGASVPIGQPINNTQVYVLDKHLHLVPAGVRGELYIGGDGLARGYCNEPGMTAEKFIPNPFSQIPGSRLYKTGDTVRHLADGNIEFIGRTDNQIKLRGYRIELGEIETHLRDHHTVKEAVAIVRQDQAANHQIIAYVVMKEDATQLATPDHAEINLQLRNHLKQRVPDYMLPALIVPIDAVPLTSNGKLDRACLPDPSLSLRHTGGRFTPPRTPNEEIVASIWLDLLDINICSIHDSFFDLGGHSLLATRLASKLRAAFAIELPLRAIFDKPTIAQQAALIESASSGHSAGLVPPLLRADRQSVMPLSYAQERLWFLAQFQPDSPFYNVPAVVRLSGPLNVPALRSSLQAVINRHESLRTVFDIESGQPVQRVLQDQQFVCSKRI